MPRKTIMLIGIILVLIELSGFPYSFKSLAVIVTGAILVIIAMRRSRGYDVGANRNELNTQNKFDSSDNKSDKNSLIHNESGGDQNRA